MKRSPLYHIDENSNVRIWWMEQDGNKYRTVSGIEGGQLVTSEWKIAKPKNVGRANATTGEEQAAAEIESQYTKKLDRKYSRDKNAASKSNIIEPMLADKFKTWDKKWDVVYVQPKLDGMRCLATRYGLFSRQGKPIVSVPHLTLAIEPFFEIYPELVLDGELYNHDLRDDFNELISIARKTVPTADDWKKSSETIQYHVYDVIADRNFSERIKFLEHEFGLIKTKAIKIVTTSAVVSSEELDATYAAMLQDGYEGQMIRLDAPYEQKRTKSLLKRKEFMDEEFSVVEILEGQGNWSGYAKSVMCRDKSGIEFNAGIKGTQEFAKELLTRKPVPKTVTVRYQNKTPDGSYRFPVAVAFYENERDI